MPPFSRLWKKVSRSNRTKQSARKRRAAVRQRSSLYESLEDRRLMIATPLKFDFGIQGSPVAAGYNEVRVGTTYADPPGYGWEKSPVGGFSDSDPLLSDWQRDYNQGSDPRVFKVKVDADPGQYDVSLHSGADTLSQSNVQVHLEGATAFSFSTAAENYFSGTYRVSVSDGELTVMIQDTDVSSKRWFINALEVVPYSQAPALTLSGTVTYAENNVAVTLAGAATVTDADSTNFNGGTLTVAISANAEAADVLKVLPVGTAPGQIGVSGSDVTYGGVVIGTASGGQGATPLTISLNQNATAATTQALVRRIGFECTSNTPSTAPRTVTFQLTDGDGGVSNVPTKTVNVVPTNDTPFGDWGGTTTYLQTSPPVPVIVAAGAFFTDVDSPTLGGGNLTVTITANADVGDRLGLLTAGNGTGQIAVTSGGAVSYEGQVIGQATGGIGAQALVVSLNDFATPGAVQALLQRLTFSTDGNPISVATRTIAFTVNDGDDSDPKTSPAATKTIAVNDRPVISTVAPVTVNQNSSSQPIAFTVTDQTSSNLTVTAVSSNPAVIPNAGLVLSGSGSSRTITITPANGQTGSATITLTVSDGSLISTTSFGVTVNPPPVISGLASTSANEDTSLSVNFAISDEDPATASITATSDDPQLISSITTSGSGANRSLVITPTLNQSGTANITVTATDIYGASTSQTFSIVVNAVNDAPTISAPAAPAQYIEDGPPVVIMPDVTVADPDSVQFNGGSLVVSFLANGAANDRLAIQNHGTGARQIGVSGSNVTYGGMIIGTVTGNNTAGPLTITFTTNDATVAAAEALVRAITFESINHSNPSGLDRTVLFVLNDGQGGGERQQTVEVSLTNDAPTLSVIADRTINENSSTTINFTIGDVDSPLANLQVSGSSSNATLVASSGIVLSGIGSSRTLTITPAANEYGTATITVSVFDGQETTIRSFTLSVNRAPTITPIADAATNQDAGTAVSFTIADVDTPLANLLVTATSSNTLLIPNANLLLTGSGQGRTLTMTSAAGQYGTTVITVSVFDGNATTTASFTLTVNGAPTLSPLPTTTVNEDLTATVGFTVGDFETPLGDLQITTASSNPALVPDGNIVVIGSGANRMLSITPAANQSGDANITVSVFDGSITTVQTFTLHVQAVDDAPNVPPIAAANVNEDDSIIVDFTLDDIDTPLATLQITTSSSNPALVPNGNMVVGGGGTNRTLTIIPAATQYGDTIITVSIFDGVNTSTQSFLLHVGGINDLPTLTAIADQTINEDATTGAVSFTLGDVETVAESLTVSTSSSNPALVPLSGIVISGAGAERTVTITPAANQYGSATITLTVTDADEGTTNRTFTVTVDPVNDAPTLTAIADQTINEDATTGAVTFTLGDEETVAESLTVSTSSSNPALVPLSGIVISGAGAERTVTITPAANQYGSATIVLTVLDADGGAKSRSFRVTVISVNDAPIGTADAYNTVEDTPLTIAAGAGLLVNDADTERNTFSISRVNGSSINVGVPLTLSHGTLTVNADGSFSFAPIADVFGQQTFTYHVKDALENLTPVTVSIDIASVNDAPTISTILDDFTDESTSKTIAFLIDDIETLGDLFVTASSSNTTLFPSGSITLGGSGVNRTVRLAPAANLAGTATITITVSDGQVAQSEAFDFSVGNQVSVEALDPIAAEDGSNTGRFRFIRSGDLGQSLIAYYIVGGTATDGIDYSSIGSVYFHNYSSEAFIDISPTLDGIVEGNETVVLTLDTHAGYQINASSSAATVTIEDGQPLTLSIEASDPAAGEDGPNAGQFVIRRVGGNLAESLIAYYSIGGTATDGTDYTSLGSVYFHNHSSEAFVDITPVADGIIEGSESIKLTLTSSNDYEINPTSSSATVTIEDGQPLTVSIEALDMSASEIGPDSGKFLIRRSGGNLAESLVVVYSIGGTATHGTDYSSLNGSVYFSSFSSEMIIDIAPLMDNPAEGNETVQLTISESNYYTRSVTSSSATVTIADAPPATVSIEAYDSIANEAGNQGRFRLVRSGGNLAESLMVYYSIGGVATSGVDYAFLTSSAYFASNSTELFIDIVGLADAAVESSESVQLSLLSYSDYVVSGELSSAVVTIEDTPPALVTLETLDTQAAERGGNYGRLKLKRTGGDLAQSLTVYYNVGGTANNGSDYKYLANSAYFSSYSSEVFLDIRPLSDGSEEDDETVVVTLMSSSAYLVNSSSPSAIVTIEDVPATIVTISYYANEQQSIIVPQATGGTWTLSFNGQTTTPLVHAATAQQVEDALEALSTVGGGNVIVSGEGTLQTPFLVTFLKSRGQSNQPQLTADTSNLTNVSALTTSVTSETEGENGPSELAKITIESPDGMSVLSTGSGKVRFYWGEAGIGQYPQNQTPRKSISIPWNSSIQDIKEAIEQIPNMVAAGGTVNVIELESILTRRVFTVEFSGALAGREISSLTIVNDVDTDPVKSASGKEAWVAAETVTDGALGDRDEVQIVNVANALRGTFQLSFAGQPTTPLAFTATALEIQQALESLSTIGQWNVQVTGPTSGPWRVAFTGALRGRDLPLLSIDSSELIGGQIVIETVQEGGEILGKDVTEGESASVTVYRNGDLTASLTVNYFVGLSSTAQSGTDFQALSGQVTFAPGQATTTILISTIDDQLAESTENIVITLTSASGNSDEPSYFWGQPFSSFIPLLDNDTIVPTQTISVGSTGNAHEGGTPGFVRLQRSTSAGTVTVHYSISLASTASSSDYVQLSGTATIPEGAAFVDIGIQAIDDLLYEGTEQLQITLTSIDSPHYTYSGSTTASLSLIDNDPEFTIPRISIVEMKATFESGQVGRFRIRREGVTDVTTQVNFILDEIFGKAENGIDFQLISGTTVQSPNAGIITFLPGETEKIIEVIALDDALVEGTERIQLTLVPDSSYTLGITASGTVRIVDNDHAATGPSVSQFHLVNDTGVSNTDRSTFDPRVTGQVIGSLSGGTARIEFLHNNNDAIVDGYVDVAATGTTLTYDPRTPDPNFASQLGSRMLRYRVVTLDSQQNVVSTGAWSSFGFILEQGPSQGPVRLSDVRLKHDTGTDSTDKITVNPTLVGTVLGDFQGTTVRIDFDHLGNGTYDGSVVVSASGQAFTYDPRQHDATVAAHRGAFTLNYRLVTIDAQNNETVQDTGSINVTLEAMPTSRYYVQDLRTSTSPAAEFSSPQMTLVGQVYTGTSTGTPTLPAPDAPPTEEATYVPVEFAYGSTAIVSGRTHTNSDRSFTFVPTGLSYGQHTIYARALEWSTDSGGYLAGQWAAFTIYINAPTAPQIAELRLADNGLTFNRQLVGRLDSDSESWKVKVQFDLDNNYASVEGTAWPDSLGQFSFNAKTVGGGLRTVHARTVSWDSNTNQEVIGSWQSFPISFPLDVTPGVPTLSLLTDTGSSSTDRFTSVSTLVGKVPIDNRLEDVQVELYLRIDTQPLSGNPDGFVWTQADGAFVFEPTGLSPGKYYTFARSRVWNDNTHSFVYSGWTSYFDFTLVAASNSPVSVTNLQLVQGSIATPPVTSNPTLQGKLVNSDGGVGYLTIQFDHGNDGTVDGTTKSDAAGQFTYYARGLTTGLHTIAARAVEWDPVTQQNAIGPPTLFTFSLEATANAAPVIGELHLLSDSGPSSTDLLTANPTLVGKVTDDGNVAGITIEFDHGNGGDLVDGVATTDAAGNFRYMPSGLVYSQTPILMRARAVQWDSATGTYLRGPWKEREFTYENQPNLAAKIVDFYLAESLTNSPSAGKSIRGRITNEGALDGVTIEFDYTNDGTTQVEQSTATNQDGEFAIQPNGLSLSQVSIQVRTRETDPITRQFIYSAWTTYSLDYSQPASSAVDVNSLQLVNDTGPSNTDRVTTDPTIKGTINHADLSTHVIILFDYDGNETPEGQVLADENGAFTYSPDGLATNQNHVIRARTKTYSSGGSVVLGQWLSLPFRLDAAPAAAHITSLGLASDTGVSNTDGSTADSRLTGQVYVPSGVYVTIEFDQDGDGVVDASQAAWGSGNFTYSPQNVTEGLNTVFARVKTQGGTNFGAGEWVSYSFVFSVNPDSPEAQADVPLLTTLNRGSQSAQSTYSSSINGAHSTHQSSTNTANASYADTVALANATRESTVAAAQSNYDTQVSAADAAYVAAVEAANAAFLNGLATFNGDTTSFALKPFSQSDAPATNRLQIPDDGSLPPPPVGAPTYTGPQYDFGTDLVYRAANAALEAVYRASILGADLAFKAAAENARIVFDAAVETAQDVFRNAIEAAEDAYRAALDSQHPSIDLTAETQAHRDRVQTAWDNYQQSLRSLDESFDTLMDSIYGTLQDAISSANTQYNSAYQSASSALSQALQPPNLSDEARRSAYISFNQALFNAAQDRDNTIANARRAYDSSVNDPAKQLAIDKAAALETYQKAVADSEHTLDAKVAEHARWKATQEINAKKAFEQAKLNAEKTRAKSIADAEKIRADAVSDAERTRTVAKANATVTKWRSEVAARQASLVAWNLVQGTPWSAYQLQLVNNEAQYIDLRATAYLSQVTAVADAALVEDKAINTAAKVRAYARADADFTRDSSILTAKANYWATPADAAKTRSLAESDHRQTWRHAWSEAVKTHADAIATAQYTRADTVSQALYDYDSGMINERQFRVESTPGSAYYYGGTYIDPSSSIDLSAERDKTLAQASHDYQIDLIDGAEVYGSTIRTASKVRGDDDREARDEEQDAIETALTTYQIAVAGADRTRAVQDVADDGAQSTAVSAAHVTYVGVEAYQEKLFTTASVSHSGGRKAADATAEKTFKVGEANSYYAAMNGWNATEESRWSLYHLYLAAAETTWANDSGDANIAYVNAVNSADWARIGFVAAAQETFANSSAVAQNVQTVAFVAAANVYATNMGAAKLTYATILINAGIENARERRLAQSKYDADAAQFEFDEANTRSTAEFAYQRAVTDAALTYQHATIDAWRSYAQAGHSEAAYTVYQDALQSAWQSQDDTVHGAWDVLRESRAESIYNRRIFYATAGQERATANQDDQLTYVTAKTGADKSLASATRGHVIVLANSTATAKITFATSVANAEKLFNDTVQLHSATHQLSLTAANGNLSVAQTDIASQRTEGRTAARGLYEVGLYVDHADALELVANSEDTPIAHYHAAVAAADAAWAEGMRIARNTEEDANSLAAYNYAVALATAANVFAAAAAPINNTFEYAKNEAERVNKIAQATAEANLHAGGIVVEAIHTEQSAIAEATYVLAVAEAKTTLFNESTLFNIAYATAVAEAEKQYYLDSTDEWNTTAPVYSGFSGGYGYGYYGSYYGGYYGGYYGYWGYGYGGYVYGPWNGTQGGLGGYGIGSYGTGWGGYGGWGYSYYGYGWGTPSGSFDQEAWDRYQQALEDAKETLEADSKPSKLEYLTAVGDAQIERATDLGDAKVTLATGRGEIAKAYIANSDAARAALLVASHTAEQSRFGPITLASETQQIDNLVAQIDLTKAQGVAAVNRQADEGPVNIALATAIATAEAAFQIETAEQQAVVATDNASALNTPQANFDALYAEAKVDWFTQLKQDFVTHATAIATADATMDNKIAEALRIRNNSRADSEAGKSLDAFYRQTARESAMLGASHSKLQNELGLTNARRGAHAANLKLHEVAVATSEKQLAINQATIEKQYQLDKANEVSIADDDRKEAMADATRDQAIAAADGKRTWRNGEALANKTYLLGQIPVNYTFALAQANVEYSEAIALSSSEIDYDNALALAEKVYSNADTVAKNAQRVSVAEADAAFRVAEENARIVAHTTIDTGLQSPWSQFLVDSAVAQRDWAQAMSPLYVTKEQQVTAAENTYQQTFSAAYIAYKTSLNYARGQQAVAVADAQYAQALDEVLASNNFISGSAIAAEAYIQNAALAERNFEAAMAVATRNLAVNNDNAAYQQAVKQAESIKKSALGVAKRGYFSSHAGATATKLVALATADHEATLDIIAAELAQAQATARATRVFDVAKANANDTLLTGRVTLETDYEADDAAEFAAQLAALNTSHPSPWAAHDAQKAAAQNTRVAAETADRLTREVAAIHAETARTIALANAMEAFSSLYASANWAIDYAYSFAQLAVTNAQAQLINAWGATGVYAATLPAFSTTPDLSTLYVVASAGSADYGESGPSIDLGLYPYGWWGGYYGYDSYYGYGGYGYGMYDVGYLGYFGDYGWYGDAASSSPGSSLSGPADPALGSDFWDFAKAIPNADPTDLLSRYTLEVEDITPKDDGHFSLAPLAAMLGAAVGGTISYSAASETFQQAPSAPSGGATAAAPTTPTIVRNSLQWKQEEVQGMLDNIDPELGAFWKKYGTLFKHDGNFIPFKRQPRPGFQPTGMEVGVWVPGDWDSRKVAWEISGRARNAAWLGTDPIYAAFQRYLAKGQRDLAPSFLGSKKLQDKSVYHLDGWGGTRVGRLDGNGWVYLDIGGRARESALEIVDNQRWGSRTPADQINDVLEGTRSPYHFDEKSTSIGIFIDGTSNHLESLTNISKLYNAYKGTKFYHGGVANMTDYRGLAKFSARNGGEDWENVLKRAKADILDSLKLLQKSGKKIYVDVFGFSRGAFIATELARELQGQVEIRFLGLFDPVYSVSQNGLQPGQGSEQTKQTDEGFSGNYVSTTLPKNVKVATIYYAAHETRSWFPATFMDWSPSTKVNLVRGVGGHGDVGGHWQNGEFLQKMTLHGMWKHAKDAGLNFNDGSSLDDQIRDYFASQHTRDLEYASVSNVARLTDLWTDMQAAKQWRIITAGEYKELVESNKEETWRAGIRTGQGLPFNAAKVVPVVLKGVAPGANAIYEAAKGPDNGRQPWQNAYPRKMWWASDDLSDLYPGISDEVLREVAKWRLREDSTGGSSQRGWNPNSQTIKLGE